MSDTLLTITAIDHAGASHTLIAAPGFTLMEVITEHLPLKAECGGACSCATCHVYVVAPDAFPAIGEEENDMLDMAFEVGDNSRLSCQLVLDDSHDQLTVTLAPGTEKSAT